MWDVKDDNLQVIFSLPQPLSWYELSKPLFCEPLENKWMSVLHFCVD